MIDLHLHLDGSITPKIAIKLAKIQNITLPSNNEQVLLSHLTAPSDCKSLNDYLKCFSLPLELMQTKIGIENAVYLVCLELKKLKMSYCEIRFAPQLHTNNGLTQDEIVKCAITGLERSKFNAKLILCLMRGLQNQEQNFKTIDTAKKYLGKGVVAIDLAGAEGLYPTKLFKEFFSYANSLNIPFTIHSGEADGASSVIDAIEFGAKRIGHGIHSLQDESCIKLLVDKKIPLELCPTSNFQTKAVTNNQPYPIKELMQKGVIVTVNTDNMVVSNTNIYKEFALLNLSQQEIKNLIKNSFTYSFK